MNKQKQLWEKLAKENSLYYINSDKGRNISQTDFKESGKETFIKYIFEDPIFDKFDSIVDVGCGNGRLTEFMAWKFKRVVGVDISGEMIRQANERLKNYPNIELYETDGESIPIPDASVQYVFSYLVFQHMKTRDMVQKNFLEAYRVLQPRGIFKVLLRTDEQSNMDAWWTGVHYNEETAKDLYIPIGFNLIKLEQVKTYAMWLWLQK